MVETQVKEVESTNEVVIDAEVKVARLTYSERLEALIEQMTVEFQPARDLFAQAFPPVEGKKQVTHFEDLKDLEDLARDEGKFLIIRQLRGRRVFVRLASEEAHDELLELVEGIERSDIERRHRMTPEQREAAKAARKAAKESEVKTVPVEPETSVDAKESSDFFEASLNAIEAL